MEDLGRGSETQPGDALLVEVDYRKFPVLRIGEVNGNVEIQIDSFNRKEARLRNPALLLDTARSIAQVGAVLVARYVYFHWKQIIDQGSLPQDSIFSDGRNIADIHILKEKRAKPFALNGVETVRYIIRGSMIKLFAAKTLIPVREAKSEIPLGLQTWCKLDLDILEYRTQSLPPEQNWRPFGMVGVEYFLYRNDIGIYTLRGDTKYILIPTEDMVARFETELNSKRKLMNRTQFYAKYPILSFFEHGKKP